MLITKVKNTSLIYPSQIGLTQNNFNSEENNFLNILKKNKTINLYSFYFKFIENSKGQIIFGEFPHIIEPKIYFENDYKIISLKYRNEYFSWHILFSKIKFMTFEHNQNQQTFFNLNILGIIIPYEFRDYVKKNFFDEYINNNFCSLEKADYNNYFYYVCNDKINISKFGNIEFYYKELNFTFILNNNDLFIKKDNKYFCLILFEEGKRNYLWYFGEVFIKKYTFVFSQENRTIGFYTKKHNGNFNFNIQISWILVIIFFFTSIILGFILYKVLIKRKRKIRANELEDEYDYISKTNDYKIIEKIN